MANGWRRWLPGPRHGLARGVAVYGQPRPDPERLPGLLGRCGELRGWARERGLALADDPGDLSLLDRAIDEELAGPEPPSRLAALAGEAGLFLGTVIVASIPGARWRLWPNGHPVVRRATGRDLDVVALASDRISTGTPRLASIHAAAQAG